MFVSLTILHLFFFDVLTNQMTTEDDLDTETLQAQIDLSLAYVGDLVSSWIKPSVKASLPKYDGTKERELEEIMRRPPRCV
jgi:hypothetical protein